MIDLRAISRKISLFVLFSLPALAILVSEVCAAQDIGYLWVTSQPKYALVYLDARYIDTTPMSKWTELKTGRYAIALSISGYKLYENTISIRQGQVLEVNVALAKQDSGESSRLISSRYVEVYITVTSKPSGADVYLDDEPIGKTQIIDYGIQPVEQRDRKLKIVRPGYKAHEETINWTDIRDKMKISISAELEPLEQAKQAVDTIPPVKPRRGRRFVINTNVIALFILLLVTIAILAARIVIRLRQRAGDG